MATFVNPNSCNPVSCYLVFNDSSPAEYETPVLENGQLTLDDGTNQVKICYANILCGGDGAAEICYTAGTAKQSTVTVVTAPSSSCCGNTISYGITIRWNIACGQWQEETFEVIGQGDASDTVTTIATRLKDAINANPLIPVSATNVAGVITLVADEAGIDFHTAVSASVNGAITTAVTVANVNPFGRPEDLEAMGVPSDLVDQSATYNAVHLVYWGTADSTTQQPKCKCYVLKDCWVFVENGGTAEADILTGTDALEDMLAGSTSGSLTVGDYIGKQSTFCA